MASIDDLISALDNADKAGDTAAANDLILAIQQHPDYKTKTEPAAIETDPLELIPQTPPTPVQEPEPQKPGLIKRTVAGISELITGKERTTPEIEAVGNITELPELSKLDFLSTLSAVSADSEETALILKRNFPNLQVRTDEQGNYIFKSPTDGKEYGIKPGLEMRDIGKAMGTALLFGPAGKLSSLGLRILGAGLTQLGVETLQTKTGGKFDPELLLLSAGSELIAPTAIAAKQAATRAPAAAKAAITRPFITETIEEVSPATVQALKKEAPTEVLEALTQQPPTPPYRAYGCAH